MTNMRYQIGDIIARRRVALGLSLRQLEQKCGVTWKTIYMIDNGRSAGRFDSVERILAALGMELEVIS